MEWGRHMSGVEGVAEKQKSPGIKKKKCRQEVPELEKQTKHTKLQDHERMREHRYSSVYDARGEMV